MEPTPLGPVVCQAIDDIHALVEHGALRAGRLPSERELAVRLGVSRSTVHVALAHMREEGQVEVRRGRNGGAYVLDSGSSWDAAGRMEIESRSSRLIDRQAGTATSFASMMASLGIAHETRVIHAAREVCPDDICRQFWAEEQETSEEHEGNEARAACWPEGAEHSSAGAQPTSCEADGIARTCDLFRIERVRSAQGSAVSFEQTYLDPRRFPRFLKLDLTQSITDLLCEVCGVTISRAEETVEVVAAHGKCARYLGIEEGYPVLRVLSRLFDDAGRVAVASCDSYNPNLVRLTVTSGVMTAENPPTP